jgi:hypothetical protein
MIYVRGTDGQPLTCRGAVWKYELELRSLQPVEMPQGAKPLSAQYQGDTLVLWCLVAPSAPRRDYWIGILGTGIEGEFSPRWQYVSTVQQPGAPLVWHVFFDGGD